MAKSLNSFNITLPFAVPGNRNRGKPRTSLATRSRTRRRPRCLKKIRYVAGSTFYVRANGGTTEKRVEMRWKIPKPKG
jgi:hypothetical protein